MNLTPQGKKIKNKQVGLYQVKPCTAKGTINKMKRETPEWVKIFANHISDKGLICKICNKLID